VQQRGAAVIKARKLSSALSAASAACDHMRDWVLGTPEVDSLTRIFLDLRKFIVNSHLEIDVFFFQEIIIGQWSLLANLSCFSLYLVFREHGFPWEYILMDLMGFNLALYTLSQLPARRANGPLCRVISTSFYFLLFVSRFVWVYSVNISCEMI
jgi:hypothetical protein